MDSHMQDPAPTDFMIHSYAFMGYRVSGLRANDLIHLGLANGFRFKSQSEMVSYFFDNRQPLNLGTLNL